MTSHDPGPVWAYSPASEVIAAVHRAAGVPLDRLLAPTRETPAVEWRKVLMRLLHDRSMLSWAAIAALTGVQRSGNLSAAAQNAHPGLLARAYEELDGG